MVASFLATPSPACAIPPPRLGLEPSAPPPHETPPPSSPRPPRLPARAIPSATSWRPLTLISPSRPPRQFMRPLRMCGVGSGLSNWTAFRCNPGARASRLEKSVVQCCAYTGFSIHSMACSVALDDVVLRKVEAAAYWTAVAPNVEEYGSVVARAITSGDDNVAKGILWRGVMTVDMLPWGTRFVGLFLSRKLVQEGHQVTLFTRGKAPITQQLPGESDAEYAEFSSKVLHLKGDRKDFDFVKTSLSAKGFNVIYDINGREATEVSPILEALFIYCSSAESTLNICGPKKRHKESWNHEPLETSGVNWASIDGSTSDPLNYNPVEEWFFHRLKVGRRSPSLTLGTRSPTRPCQGRALTCMRWCCYRDLATAFIKVSATPSEQAGVQHLGSKYVTFDGIARACAKEIIHYNPKDFDFARRRPSLETSISWRGEGQPRTSGLRRIDLLGLTDSYNLNFDRGTFRKEADFTTDDMILGKKLEAETAFGQAEVMWRRRGGGGRSLHEMEGETGKRRQGDGNGRSVPWYAARDEGLKVALQREKKVRDVRMVPPLKVKKLSDKVILQSRGSALAVGSDFTAGYDLSRSVHLLCV
ncbi:hypothetical protein ZWY2020_038893 [Hordeum vulgare]|nr:hypothetical protein ZWY2020_038893 [Hordeum vulgare]